MAYEPVDGAASSALDEIVHGPAAALTAVTLLVGGSARASGWAARTAVALAARWPGPRRVVLVDLDVAQPSLHEHAGVANDEGIADVVDYGVSLALVRQRVPGGDFDLVATGLYVADPGAVLRSDEWSRVLQDTAVQRETLLAYVPADAEGADAMVRRTGAVLVLCEADEADGMVRALPEPYAVLAVLTPPTAADSAADDDAREYGATGGPLVIDVTAADDKALAPATDPPEPADEPLVIAAAADELLGSAAPVSVPEAPRVDVGTGTAGGGAGRLSDAEFERIRLPTDRPARESLIADLRERQRAARMASPLDVEPGGLQELASRDEQGSRAAGTVLLPAGGGERARDVRVETMGDEVALDTLDPGAPSEPRSRSYRKPLIWTLFVVLTVSMLGGAWRYLAGRLGVERTPAASTASQPPPPAPVPVPVEPQPAEQALPYVVAIEAHTDLATAFRRVDALAQTPGLSFHIAPLEREGTLYYHVMAGPVTDSAAAVALRDTLLARRIKTAATPTDVRHAPLSFVIGDYSARDAADEAMSELRRLDVPAYMHLAEATDGAPLFRVFVGAYSAPAEADVTRQLLRAAGVRDSLVTRTGSTTQ